MADDKTVSLRVDGSQGEDALKGIERAAEGAAEAMGKLDSEIKQAEGAAKGLGDAAKGAADKVGVLGAEVKKTEENTKRLAGTNREYESAARSVGNSVQAITRLEAAWRASILDTQNSEKVRAAALAVVFSRNIGGAADEARAMEMLAGNHKDAAAAIRFMNQHGAVVAPHMNNAALASLAFGSRLGNLSNVAQQAGYQVADMANQIGNGTSAYTAVGQQMGQLLGVFGATGAVVGAAVSVMAPLAGKLLDTASAAKEAGQAQKDYNAALREGEGLLRTEAALEGERAERIREGAIQARTDQYEKLQREIASLELKRRENTAVTPTETGEGDATILNEKEEARLQGLITIKQRQLSELQAQIGGLTNQNPQATAVKRNVLSSGDGLESMTAQRGAIQDAIDIAAAAGDEAALKELTEAYGALNRGIATFVSEGQREVLMSEARAKASTMTSAAGQEYLTVRMAEIGMMGKAIELGELEQQQKAAQVEATATAAKAYRDMAKAMTMGEIETTAKIAVSGLDAERQALAQRRALGEIGAADELTLALDIEERRRQIAEQAAQAKLSLLRRTAGTERTEIDAAERAITELRAKHSLEQIKQVDAELAARRAAARQVAETGIKDNADKGKDGIAAREENLSFNKAMGNIGGAEEIAELRAIAEEKIRIRREELEATLQLAGLEQTERNRINKELVGLERQRALEMSKIDHQETRDRLAEIKGWTAPFNQAVNSTVTGFIQGTLTKKQAAAQAAQSIAASYLSKFATIATDWFNKNILMAAWDSLFAQKSVADKVQTEALKQGAVAGSEAAQTGAVISGVAARTTAETAGNAATKTSAIGKIMTKAGEAAATVYSEVAEIPYVGWILAPVAAAAAFTAVAGYTAFSAEGGWGEVPEDGARAVLHKKEMVLPARYAEPLRQMLTSSAPAQAISAVASGGGPLVASAAASALSAIGNANVGRRAEAFTAPLSGGGLDHRAAIAALAAGNIGIPSAGRFALPDWLGKGPNFQPTSNTTNVTNKSGGTHVTVPTTINIHALDGASVKRVLMSNPEAVSDALQKAVRNGTSSALYVTRKK